MTPRERDLLDAIKAGTVRGVVPTFAELCAALGLSSRAGICRLMQSLERQGVIRRHPGYARSYEVVADNPAYTAGAIAALSGPEFDRLKETVRADDMRRLRDAAISDARPAA